MRRDRVIFESQKNDFSTTGYFGWCEQREECVRSAVTPWLHVLEMLVLSFLSSLTSWRNIQCFEETQFEASVAQVGKFTVGRSE